MGEIQNKCPQCGRLLALNETGRIGKCPHHQTWFAAVGGAEGEASQKNAEDQREKERLAREQEEAKRQAEALRQRRTRASAYKKILLLAAVLAAAAVVIFLLILRPSASYDKANSLLADKQYSQAKEGYIELGDYKNAAERAALCDALMCFDEGRVYDAIDMLEALVASGDQTCVSMIRDACIPAMQNWRARGISPEHMLKLLAMRDQLDVSNALDYDQLYYEAHAGLLGADARQSMAYDADGDGARELIALKPDLSLAAYIMEPSGNAETALDPAVAASLFTAFGDELIDNNVDDALACYEEADRIAPDDATKGRVALAYRIRAERAEAEGDTASALSDALKAVNASGAVDDFDFYYNIAFNDCLAESDQQAGIARWSGFIASDISLIRRFDAVERADADAGRLRLSYALTLANNKDYACVALIREARELGADIEKALLDAIAPQAPGLLLARLRAEAIDLYARDPEKQGEQRALLAIEIASALNNRQSLGITGAEALNLLRFADELEVELDGVNRETAFEQAAIAAAGAEGALQNAFVNWDGDAYMELLTIDSAGELRYCALRDEWRTVSTYDTLFESASLTLFTRDKPLVLVAADEGMAVLQYEGGGVSLLFREDGITRYRRADDVITYDRTLPGSIERSERYVYAISASDARPTLSGVAWREDDYPYPETAKQALTRWLEARAYALEREQALLVADFEYAELGFSLDELNALPAPDSAAAIEVYAYDAQKDAVLLEAVYTSSGKSSRGYFACVLQADRWKLAGVSNAFAPGAQDAAQEHALPLLALNEATTGGLDSKTDIDNYRVLLPRASEVALLWQAGNAAKSSTAFIVTIYSADDLTAPVISYNLSLSAGKQLSHPLFLSPGVYYVSVAAKTYSDLPYSLTLLCEPNPYIESEDNDTPAEADDIQPNRAYAGSLIDAKDADCYAVELTEAGRLNALIQADDEGQRSARYNILIADALSGTALTSFQLPGNSKEARSCNLYLAPGKYVISVSKGSYVSTAAYRLTAEFEPVALCERELNGDASSANVIPLNESITGSFGVEGDIDVYAFALEKDGVIQPRLTFAPLETSSRTYALSVISDAQTLLTAYIGGKESQKVIPPLALPAGNYMIRLANPRFTAQDYALNVLCVGVPRAEIEPNDALSQATALELGAPTTGVLSTQDDTDLYAFMLAEEAVSTLRFNFPPSTVEGTVYAIRLEQNGKTLWSTNVKGASGGFAQQLKIPAGAYYLRVRPVTWISAVYEIALD